MTQARGARLTLAASTLVYGAEGRLPALYFEAGDRLICARRGMVRLTGVTRWRTTVQMVRIPPGAFGPTQPAAPLVLPQDTLAQLAMPGSVTTEPLEQVSVGLVTLHLPGPAVLLADGVKLATCGADGTRAAA